MQPSVFCFYCVFSRFPRICWRKFSAWTFFTWKSVLALQCSLPLHRYCTCDRQLVVLSGGILWWMCVHLSMHFKVWYRHLQFPSLWVFATFPKLYVDTCYMLPSSDQKYLWDLYRPGMDYLFLISFGPWNSILWSPAIFLLFPMSLVHHMKFVIYKVVRIWWKSGFTNRKCK